MEKQKLILANEEEVALFSDRADAMRHHPMFSSAKSVAKLAVMEFLANQEGRTIYECMADKELSL